MIAALTAGEILSLYERFGEEDYIGEPISQIEHMCQCAMLAKHSGCDDDVILAAFFHDIGHMLEHVMPTGRMEGYGVTDHEKIGAEYLRGKGFSNKIADLVNSHVPAKRYLTFKDPGYYEQLSEASKRTLEFQGGVMSEAEALLFESDTLHPQYLQLRKWDELAKLQNVPLPSLEYFRVLMIKHLEDNVLRPL